MPLYEIISIIGFIVGTILHIVLSVLIGQRKHKKRSEFIFQFLVISVAMWHLGNTVYLFSSILFDKNLFPVNFIADAISYAGIGLMPSLLLHTAISFLYENGFTIRRSLQKLILIAIYFPVLPFSFVIKKFIRLEESYLVAHSQLVKPFIVWLIVALLISAYISKWLAKNAEEKEEQKFLMAIFWVLITIAVFIGFTVILEGRKIAYIGDYLVLVSMLSSIFPSIVFSYYVYRYNYMEFVLRRSIFYSFLTFVIICLYYFGIKQFSKFMEIKYAIHSKTLEAVFVINLVFWFPTIKEKSQKLFRKILFFRSSDTEYLLNELNHVISTDPLVNITALLENVVFSIKKATSIKTINLVLIKKNRIQIIGDKKNDVIALANLHNIIQFYSSGELVELNRYEVKDAAVISEMRLLEAIFIFPVFVKRRLKGILCMGRAKRGMPIASDNLDQLMIIANEIGSALEKSKIIEEKLFLERKMLENEKLSSLGRLSTSVAHEVKNPLSSIKAIVQAMCEDLEKEHPLQKDLDIIVGEIDRLNKVVNQLLLYAKPSGNMQEHVKIKEVIDSTLVVLNHEARQNNIAILCNISEALPLIYADKAALKEVFFNLIHNAIQATPPNGKISIDADLIPTKHFIQIKVTDTGHGIPQDSLQKIFDPFFTTKQTGTGLGLSVVKKKLEDMHATIHVESNGDGTTFVIDVPFEQMQPQAGIGEDK